MTLSLMAFRFRQVPAVGCTGLNSKPAPSAPTPVPAASHQLPLLFLPLPAPRSCQLLLLPSLCVVSGSPLGHTLIEPVPLSHRCQSVLSRGSAAPGPVACGGHHWLQDQTFTICVAFVDFSCLDLSIQRNAFSVPL